MDSRLCANIHISLQRWLPLSTVNYMSYRMMRGCFGRLASARRILVLCISHIFSQGSQRIADYENINLVSIYCKLSLFIRINDDIHAAKKTKKLISRFIKTFSAYHIFNLEY